VLAVLGQKIRMDVLTEVEVHIAQCPVPDYCLQFTLKAKRPEEKDGYSYALLFLLAVV